MLIPFSKLQSRFNVRPKGIVHVGGNRGEEASQYDAAGIKKVIWFEADPEVFVKLEETLKKYPSQKGYNYCISDQDGKESPFHIANNGGQSSSLLQLGTHKKQHPEVHYVKDINVVTRRIDALDIDFSDCDYLSADTQGSEMLVLKGMGDMIRQFKWVYLEINKAAVYVDCPHVNDLDSYLNKHGFRRVFTAQWIGDWTDALWIKK
jgi:FkbM family methyltransferase